MRSWFASPILHSLDPPPHSCFCDNENLTRLLPCFKCLRDIPLPWRWNPLGKVFRALGAGHWPPLQLPSSRPKFWPQWCHMLPHQATRLSFTSTGISACTSPHPIRPSAKLLSTHQDLAHFAACEDSSILLKLSCRLWPLIHHGPSHRPLVLALRTTDAIIHTPLSLIAWASPRIWPVS